MNFEEPTAVLYCAVMGTITLLMLVLGSSFSVSLEDETDDEDDTNLE